MTKAIIGISALLITASAFGASPKHESGLSLFAGHYGYVLSYPSDYEVTPKFGKNDDGSVDEIVDFIPSACKGATRRRCVESGMFTLYVSVRGPLFKRMGVGTLAEQVDMMVQRAKADGERPSNAFRARLGKLSGLTFVKAAPREGSFDTTTTINGKKVVYLFQYQGKNPRLGPILKSLSEVQPHDDPPRG